MSDQIILQRGNTPLKSQSTFPTEIVDLPSKGHFYPPDSPLAKGQVEIKMMTAKEEDILTSPNLLKKGQAIDKLLESLIVNKDIKVSDLLLGDKNALIFAVRRLAYGDTYGPVEVSCPKCSSNNQVEVNLSELKDKEFDETQYQPGSNVFEYTLPVSKAAIKFRILTDGDEKAIEKENVAMAKMTKGASSEVTSRLKRMIVEVNGESDPAKIRNFVDTQLLSKDSLALRQHMKTITPDVDATFEFICKDCGSAERAAVPMTVQFFWPDSRV